MPVIFRAPERAALAVLLLSLIGAALAAYVQDNANRLRTMRAFEVAVNRLVTEVEARVQRYEYGVRGARGAVIGAGGDSINLERFQQYAASRDIRKEFPGARGFGFIRRVRPEDVDAFVVAARAEHRPDFAIRQIGPNPGEQWVIQYIEPEVNNRPAVGLDIASDQNRRAAAQRAMDSGSAQLTAPIQLVQAGIGQGGFLLLLPVFNPMLPIATEDDRRAACIGWSYAPLIIDEILGGLGDGTSGVELQFTDATAGDAEQVFFSSGQPFEADVGRLQTHRDLQVYGRHWRIEARALPSLVAGIGLHSPWRAAATVGGIGTLVAGILLMMLRARARHHDEAAQQENLARGVVDAIPHAILVVDPSGQIVQANRSATSIFGYERPALIGRPIETLVPSDHRHHHGRLRQGYDHATRAMGARSDLWALHADGHNFPVEINLSSLPLGDQRLVVAGVIDVTEQRAARQRLEQSEARWQQMANSQPQLIWTCLGDGPCDFLSQRWVEYTGIPEQDQLGYAWLEQVHPDDRPVLRTRWQQAVDTRSVFRVEFRIRRSDGEYRWFDTQAVPLLNAEGRVERWIGSNTDIHQRRQIEASLRELNATLESRVTERTALLERARADLQSILDAIPSMIGYWDRDLRNRFANHAYRNWFGIDPATLPGRTMPEVLGADLFERNRPYVEGALAGIPQQFERLIGERHSVARYLPDQVGDQVRGFYAFVTDVTELKKAQEAAEAASAAKSSFLANMSHEIRTPMNAVMNLSYLLEQSELTFEQRDLVAKMRIASRSLLGLINDVLDLSKIEAGQMGVASEAFALREVLEDAVQLHAAQAASRRIELALDVGDEVPAYLRGDSLRLHQVLSNLLGNAVKFTEQGSVRLQVRGESRHGGIARLYFAVTDTGIGIAPSAQSHLFEPFTQADQSTTRRFGGSGLGLAIVKRLVDLMGGELGVRSEVGEGSCFWFRLELKEEAEATIVGTSPKAIDALVADDSASERDALGAAARALGWRAEVVASGAEALDRIADRLRTGRKFDALVIDWRMPGLDGLETIAELRQRHQGEPLPAVIVVTAYDRSELEALPAASMADAVLSKPVDASMLFNAVHEVISRRTGSTDRLALARSSVSDGSLRLPGVRVLLVDDNSINLDVGQRILEREGATLTLATQGQMALELLQNAGEPFDAVLMDVQMPVMDGNEATRRIRQELGATDLPIIALTAGALVSERERAMEAGMNEFIAKPFDADVMIGVIRRLVERHRGSALPVRRRQSKDPVSPSDAPRIHGLDLAEAGERLGRDWALLRSLLRRLFEEFATGWDTAASPESLAARAHKLRGVAGNVGARALRERAGLLETAARSPDAGSSLAGRIADLEIELGRLHAACAEFLAAPGVPQPASSGGPAPMAAGELEVLIQLLRQQSLEALQHYARLRPALEAALGPAAAALDAAIQELRFPDALDLLAALADKPAPDKDSC